VTRLAGSSKLLRAMNERAALAHLLDPGMLTRADLRKLTALSTPTISEVLRRLTDAGLVTVVGHNSGRPGPNAEVYAANPEAAFAAAMSIRDVGPGGRPSVTAALCDLTGAERGRCESLIDFVHIDPQAAVVDVMAQLCAEAGVPAERVRHVQLGVAGSYDPHTETIRHVNVPGFERPGLVPQLAEALHTPVGVDNDVNLAAVAERKRGAGRDTDGFALLWLGEEGLGLAIDIAGALIRGAHGGAGEIGFVPIHDPESHHRKLDLQNLFGGTAILELGRDHGLAGETPADVVRAGVATCSEFVTRLADRIAVGLIAVIAVLDPGLVVLAGPVAQAGGDTLLTAVTATVRKAGPLECAIAVTAIAGDAVLLGTLDAGLTAVREALLTAVRDD
jgi:predicted NBD/HSP70 family sugar kinase/DNA-binding transcriptional ArsR family regulator